MDRSAQLLDRLVQSDTQIDLGSLLERGWTRGRLYGRLLGPSRRRQGGSCCIGALTPAFAIQLGERGRGSLPGSELVSLGRLRRPCPTM